MDHAAFAMPVEPEEPRFVDSQATSGERTYATFTHLAILAFLLIGIPVIASLVMWLVKKSESPFLDDHGKEATNFQISLLLFFLISLVLIPVCGIGIVGMIGVYVLGAVGAIMAAMAANRGEFYRYPMTIRLIS